MSWELDWLKGRFSYCTNMLRILLVNIKINCPFSTLLHSTSSVVFSLSALFLGDEMGMLEDVCVSIANLTCVKFKVNMRLLNFIC